MDISRVIIFTSDVKRLSDFYRKCFGLNVIGESGEEWTELNAGSCNIAFHRFSEKIEGRDGWLKIVFGSKDVAAEKTRLEGLGVSMSDIVEFADIQLCDGRDPDGNWFQISSRGL
jgi:catechol 2,3-dioxygenase-like lactoylglutathione lyase family enzyme